MSEIRFYCQSCGKAIKVNEGLAGRFGKCPGCGERIQVPALAIQAPPATLLELGSGAESQRLISCPDCGKQISKYAKACPNCGWSSGQPSRTVAVALAWTLGGIGIHKFYLRRFGEGVAYLLLCVTLIPAFIAFLEGFSYLSMSDREFVERFGTSDSQSASKPVSPLRLDFFRWCIGVVCLLMALAWVALPAFHVAAIFLAAAGLLILPPAGKWWRTIRSGLWSAWNWLISTLPLQQIGKSLLWFIGSILIVGPPITMISQPQRWMGGVCVMALGFCVLPAAWDWLTARYEHKVNVIRVLRWSMGLLACLLLPALDVARP